MITVTKINSAQRLQDAVNYFCPNEQEQAEEKELGARAGYYYHSKELATRDGFWAGSLAAEWGVTGEKVTHDGFMTLAKGKHLVTGEQLVQPAQGKHVMASDMSISLPKGLSLFWARAEADEKRAIEQDFKAAIMDAIAHVEKQGKIVRRKINGQTVCERSDGLIIGAFEHFTARETAEVEVPDPDLHWHLLVFSVAKRQPDKLARGKKFREYGAIEERTLRTMKIELDAVVQTSLQQRFEARGITTLTQLMLDEAKNERDSTRDKNREFFVKGFTNRETIWKWSKRAQQVKSNEAELLQEKGYGDGKPVPRKVLDEVKNLAKVMGRRAKRLVPADLIERWGAELDKDGLTLDVFRAAFGGKVRQEPTRDEVLDAAIGRLHEKGAVVPWRELRSLIADEAIYRGLSGDLTKALLDETHAAEDDDRTIHEDLVVMTGLVTSRKWAEREKAIVEAVGKMASNERPPVTEGLDWHEVALDVLAEKNEGLVAEGKRPINLGKDQAAAVQKFFTRRVNLGVGQAGAGKTLPSAILVEGHRRGAAGQGKKATVVAVSVAKERAVQFGREVGADHTLSFEALAGAISGKSKLDLNLGAFDLLCIDEAVMADTERLATLLQVNPDVSLLAIGDAHQMPSIGSGAKGLWKHLEEVAGESVVIDEIHRTGREDWRGQEVDGEHRKGVWEKMRDVKSVEQAVDHYKDAHNLVILDTDKQAEAAVMDEWEQRWEGKPSRVKAVAVVCDRSNKVIDSLNEEATARLLDAGKLKGEGGKVVWVDPADRNYQREFNVYEGSYLAITKNMSIGSGKTRLDLQNGERGFVKSVERDEDGFARKVTLEVLRPSSPTVTLTSYSQIRQLRPTWVTHTYREQGSTYEQALILQGRGTNIHSAYVAATRAQDCVKVFHSAESLELEPDTLFEERVDALTKQWQKVIEQESAISFVEAADAAKSKRDAEDAERVLAEVEAEELLEAQRQEDEERRLHDEEAMDDVRHLAA